TSNEVFKNSKQSLKLTLDPLDTGSDRIEFDLGNVNLYKKNFGLWYYNPHESMIDGQRSKTRIFAYYLYTRNNGTFMVYPESDRSYEGWNYVVGNAFNGSFLGDNDLSDLEE